MDSHSEITKLQLIKASFLNTNKYFLRLIWDIRFPLFLCISLFTVMLVFYVQNFGKEHFITQMFEIVTNLSLSIIIMFLLSFYLHKRTHPKAPSESFWAFNKRVTIPWTVEGLKASSIILVSFLLIIPGFKKMIQYSFMSFVVFFNQEYQEGRLKALKHSKELSKGLFWPIFFIVIVLPVVPSLPLSTYIIDLIFKGSTTAGASYSAIAINICIDSLVGIYVYSVLYFMYVIKDRKHIQGFESAKIDY